MNQFPLSVMVGVFLFLLQVEQAAPQSVREVFARLHERALAALPGLITAAIVFLIFMAAAWVGCRLIVYAAPRVKADTGVVLLLSRIYYYSIIIFGIVTALSTTGMNVSALVTGLGLTGFAIGFALKDVLSNLLSGIMLLIYRPFRIGDQIKMGEFEGTIKTIRMRDTVVRSYDGRSIIIPNTKLITEVVVNNTARAGRLVRTSVALAISSGSDVETARELFLQAMEQNETLIGRAEPHVIVREADNSTLLEGRFWYDPRRTTRDAIKSEVAQSIEASFERAEIELTEESRERIAAQKEEVSSTGIRNRGKVEAA
ncbi:MAG TPA: mechanosensitive ion channel family protein [Pyrinomonadaceae bacterium]|nr:mechanosensitive ion channel family protein [Pyrinomonadaceae bacterium]